MVDNLFNRIFALSKTQPRLGAGCLDWHTIKRVEESEVGCFMQPLPKVIGYLLKSIKNRKKIAMLKSQGKSRIIYIIYIIYIHDLA